MQKHIVEWRQLLDEFGKKRWKLWCEVTWLCRPFIMTMGPHGAFIMPCRKHYICKAVADGSNMFLCQRKQLQPEFICRVNQQNWSCVKRWNYRRVPHNHGVHCSHPTCLIAPTLAREWEADLVKGFHRDRSRYKKSKPWQKKRKWR